LLTISSYCFLRLSLSFAVASAAFIGLATFATVYLSNAHEPMVVDRMVAYIGASHVIGLTIRQLFDMRERRIFLQTKRLKKVAVLRKRLIEAQAETSHAKTNFLAVLSHEIRTPMNTIVRLMDVIQSDIKDHLTDKRLATFKLVAQSCDRLVSTFDEMLEFAQMGGNQLAAPSAKVPFRLADLLHECSHMVQHQALEKQIVLTVYADSLCNITVLGEPQKLARVILNLTVNAIKFTHRGGVEIRATIDATRDNDFDVVIMVADSGIGIPSSQLGKIFDPFYQIDSAYTRKYEGSGLGLAICQQIMTGLSGRIDAASEEGVGSRFTVRLTLGKAKQELAAA
jgi:signal transduction histidine kinase